MHVFLHNKHAWHNVWNTQYIIFYDFEEIVSYDIVTTHSDVRNFFRFVCLSLHDRQ